MKPHNAKRTIIEQWNIGEIPWFRLRKSVKYNYYYLERQAFNKARFGKGKWRRFTKQTFETESGARMFLFNVTRLI